MIVSLSDVLPAMQVRAQRKSLGLELLLAAPIQEQQHPNSIDGGITDHVFACSKESLKLFCRDVFTIRPSTRGELERGKEVVIFIPEADPPIIRVTNRDSRGAYFTLGELCRWRLLAAPLEIPLKPYQKEGVAWLLERKSGVLADDMGLGKTIQTIAALRVHLRRGKSRNALVVCPKSLIGNWEAEIQLWAEDTCTVGLHSTVSRQEWHKLSAQCHVAITNYESLRSSPPAPGSFDVVIFDELHRLKNNQSKNYLAAGQLAPKVCWGLTGTPLENSAEDLIAVLHLLDPKKIALSDKRLSAPSLRSLASEYVLRRNRAVLADELNTVTEKTERLALTEEQRYRYNSIVRDSDWRTNQGWISTFGKLRDVCDYDPVTKASSKIRRATTIVKAIRNLGEKVVVFSYRLEPLALLREELLLSLRADQVAMITGKTGSVARSRTVAQFQSNDKPSVLLCSMRATAEGLTLTAANHVIFINEWWNPSLNAQARDRVNRIGQSREVFVYRLRTLGTVETRLDEILSKKSSLFEEIVSRLTNSSSSNAAVPMELADLIESVE